MWESISILILRYRLFFLLAMLGSTGFMLYHALDASITYDYMTVVPKDDPVAVNFKKFQETFGDDGNVMVLAIQTPDFFTKGVLNDWYTLGREVSHIRGIEGMLSVPNATLIQKDKVKKAFEVFPLMLRPLKNQQEADSLREVFFSLPFYDNLIYNRETHTSLMAITFSKTVLDSKERLAVVDSIQALAESFGEAHQIKVHFSGLPFIRTYNMRTISHELELFLILAMVIVSIILFLLFRNVFAVIFPLFVVISGAIWSMGTLTLLGYKITVLTGLIPTLIVVIGIPNTIYLLNKYHTEFKKHGNKQKALMRTISRIGQNTFFTNLTTAIGFGVFAFTDTKLLTEFGIVAFLNIMATFLISIIAIPVFYSYLPEPNFKQMVHLDRKLLNRILDRFEYWSLHYRKAIFAIFVVVLLIAAAGLLKLQAKGYILDDVSHQSSVYKDLKFIEKNFRGIMPFEVMISSKGKENVTDLSFIQKLDKVVDTLEKEAVLSKPLAISEAYKFMMQAYYNGNPRFYRLPTRFLLNQNPLLRSYLNNIKIDSSLGKSVTYISKDKKSTRISSKVADIGSDSMPKLVARLIPEIQKVFAADKYETIITGTSIIATKGFNFLIDGLIYSVVIAFIAISLIMAYLFRSFRMLSLSLLPNIFPLIITAGIMGYFNIALKPSTVLVFSVAFGISVDYTIHFLAKYRQELKRHVWDVEKTVLESMKETGVSMLYTSLILFFGFIIFTLSEFEGTANLGRMTSITLIVALLSNLLFLPSLLIWIGRSEQEKNAEKKDDSSIGSIS